MTELIILYIWLWGFHLTLNDVENEYKWLSYGFSWYLAIFIKWPYILIKVKLRKLKNNV